MIELNSETDFVARNDKFQAIVSNITGIALAKSGDIDAREGRRLSRFGAHRRGELTNAIATIGENMSLRRAAGLSVSDGVVCELCPQRQSRAASARSVSWSRWNQPAMQGKLDELGKQIAMHVAAANPQSISTADLDPELVERERSVLRDQALASGKPAELVDKMIEGRIRKYFQEVVLMEQTFVIDGETRP